MSLVDGVGIDPRDILGTGHRQEHADLQEQVEASRAVDPRLHKGGIVPLPRSVDEHWHAARPGHGVGEHAQGLGEAAAGQSDLDRLACVRVRDAHLGKVRLRGEP